MNNDDINALIAFLLLLVPFGLLWFKAFIHYKTKLTTMLSKWVLTFISLVCFSLYYYLTFLLGYVIDGRIGDSVAIGSFTAFLFSFFPLIIVTAGILILTFAYYTRKRQNQN